MLLDNFPIIVIFLILGGLAALAAEVGFPVGRWYRNEEGLEKYPLESAAKASLFGLLAFILAFAFGVSATRYQNLCDLAREDTEAIKNVFKTSQLLDDEAGKKVRDMVRAYHQTRLDAIASRNPEQLQKGIDEAEDIQSELWDHTVKLSKTSEKGVPRPFMTAVQDMDETHSKRVYRALVTRHPTIIWITLFLLLIASSFMIGFTSGLHGRRSRLPTAVLLLCFVVVIVMIIDLDRPFRSLFRSPASNNPTNLTEEMKAKP